MCNRFVSALAKSGDLVYERWVFDDMRERNVVSWSCLMSGYVR